METVKPIDAVRDIIHQKLVDKVIERTEDLDYNETAELLGMCLDTLVSEAIEDRINSLGSDQLLELL